MSISNFLTKFSIISTSLTKSSRRVSLRSCMHLPHSKLPDKNFVTGVLPPWKIYVSFYCILYVTWCTKT